MATLGDVKAFLEAVCERNPSCPVGAVLGKSEDPVDAWIVDVKDVSGEILLMLSERDSQDEARAMTAERLYQALLTLPSEEGVDVELCRFASEDLDFHADYPIAASRLNEEEDLVVFMDWDQARRRGMCQESLRVCMTCGQKKEGSNMFCLRCQAEYAERVKEATGGPEASDIEAPGTGLPQAIVPFDWSQAMEYQRATAEFLGLPVDRAIDLGQGVFLHMKLVPAGEFYRCGRFRSYRVRLTRPFYLGIYPVTQAQFEAVMGTNPSERKGADKPVVTVPLDDIETFCARLSQRSDLEVGLPTEAQREYACRAGTTSFFSFGDYVEDLSDYAWYHDNSDALPPVGKKKPNAFGFYDMHGSVREWCQDRENWDNYWKLDDSYSGGLKIDPVGCTGSYRVTCGGTWLSNASECGSAMRGLVLPIHKSFLAGFRVAAVLPVPA